MLGTIATIFMVGVGAVLGLVILAYAVYITFFSLARTIGGGLQVLKHYGEQRVRAAERAYALIPDAQLGLTMADGGDRIEDKEEKKTPERKK
ncbi:MAG: hypothetical protein JRI46_04410 [Deltaproteobacteria bacterium]|nr:hypothetical protein [Deltaproteobacteria bacterium]